MKLLCILCLVSPIVMVRLFIMWWEHSDKEERKRKEEIEERRRRWIEFVEIDTTQDPADCWKQG